MKIPGIGLAQGLAVTLRTMLRRSVTKQYPDVKPDLPPRTRGVIALLADNCTSCMLCARECPDWCIYIESHKESEPPVEEGARARTYNVLDRFDIDFSLCMYCGICIEVCPFDALFWSPEFEYAAYDIEQLTQGHGSLGDWMPTVPLESLPVLAAVGSGGPKPAPPPKPGPPKPGPPPRPGVESARPAGDQP